MHKMKHTFSPELGNGDTIAPPASEQPPESAATLTAAVCRKGELCAIPSSSLMCIPRAA
jgi:hypothetical protein